MVPSSPKCWCPVLLSFLFSTIWCPSSSSLRNSFSLGCWLHLRKHLCPDLSLTLLRHSSPVINNQASAACHDTFGTTSTVPLVGLIYSPVWLWVWDTPLATFEPQFLCDGPEGKTLRRFHFSDSGLFLITAGFSALVSQHYLSQQNKDVILGVLNKTYHTKTSVELLFYEPHNYASTVCILSSVFMFQAHTGQPEQPIKLS